MSEESSNIRVKITVSRSWDSTEVIFGTLTKEILVDNLRSALIYTERGEWLVLLPRSVGQDLLKERVEGKVALANIAWLSNRFNSTMKQITGEFFTTVSNGGAIRLE